MLVIYLLGAVLAVICPLLINKWYCGREMSDLDEFDVFGTIFIGVFSWIGVIAVIIVLLILVLFEGISWIHKKLKK